MARKGKRNQLTAVCWLYPGRRNYRPRYVNVLYRRVQKYLSVRHRFVCIYDDRSYAAKDFDEGIELHPIPDSIRHLLELGSVNGNMHPSCFPRLWHFSDEAADMFPGRVFMFDVDSIPIGEMRHLVSYRKDADFISLLRVPSAPQHQPYVTGGSWILRAGALPEVWGDFVADPEQAREDAAKWFAMGRATGWMGGSDQAWISYKLVSRMTPDGPITSWGEDCGIRLWDHFRRERGEVDGCLLHFNGPKKPWHLDWTITKELYGACEYRVVYRPLKYAGKRHEVGAPFIPRRPDHARALLLTHRIEAVG